MDALFGLPRKKSAGKSHRPPLYDSLFFKDQSSVDEYVSNSSEIRELHRVCLSLINASYCITHRLVMISLLEVHWDLQIDTVPSMRQLCLDLPVDMNFPSCLSIWSMVKGECTWTVFFMQFKVNFQVVICKVVAARNGSELSHSET